MILSYKGYVLSIAIEQILTKTNILSMSNQVHGVVHARVSTSYEIMRVVIVRIHRRTLLYCCDNIYTDNWPMVDRQRYLFFIGRYIELCRPTGAITLKHTSTIAFIICKDFRSADHRQMIGRQSAEKIYLCRRIH